MIVKEGRQYVVKSEAGRPMGTYASRAQAEHRLRQIEYFKHVKKHGLRPVSGKGK